MRNAAACLLVPYRPLAQAELRAAKKAALAARERSDVAKLQNSNSHERAAN